MATEGEIVRDILRDPITESMPKAWLSEQKQIAKEAMQMLLKHYPAYKWGIEWQPILQNEMGPMIIRLRDVPTETVYVLKYGDIDKPDFKCIITAGGLLLEAHGLSRTKWRGFEVRDQKRTPAGLIIPAYAAMPEFNPGYQKVKEQTDTLR
jgi:hypothetical protein